MTNFHYFQVLFSPVGSCSWIHRLLLCRGVWPHPMECPKYDIKLFDGKAPAQRIRGMWSTPLLLPSALRFGVVAADRVLSMGQVEQTVCKQMIDVKLKQDDQLEHTYSSYVGIWDVAVRTCQRRWTIRRSGEREREGYPCWRRDMMMMMMMMMISQY